MAWVMADVGKCTSWGGGASEVVVVGALPNDKDVTGKRFTRFD